MCIRDRSTETQWYLNSCYDRLYHSEYRPDLHKHIIDRSQKSVYEPERPIVDLKWLGKDCRKAVNEKILEIVAELEDYEEDAAKCFEEATMNICCAIFEMKEMISRTLDSYYRKIRQEIAESVESLKKEAEFYEYHANLEPLDEVMQNIYLANERMPKENHGKKEEILVSLKNNAREIKRSAQKFFLKCKESSELVKSWKKHSILELEQMRLTKIEKIKHIEETLIEKTREANNIAIISLQIIKENGQLQAEREVIAKNIKLLAHEYDELNSKYQKLERSCAEQEKEIEALDKVLQKKRNEISSLDIAIKPVSYTHLRAHETSLHLVCRLLLEKKKKKKQKNKKNTQ
eukprot:TRINITY_DN4975_c0_g2_i3.p1 TRINITY_DN4975_c0_g2~~TRINITY_DN4975_c0_g2_i3.p1  ORF type:complete len:347 (+),score=86.62 TRINITY_DN4975_c0_g2_i3:77-1117(+)